MIAHIHRETEGWPTGVYLSAIADDTPVGRDNASEVGTAHTYLMEQMLDHLSESDRTVLTEWSILRNLNGSLCDRVSDRNDSATVLYRLSEKNLLLMPLDASGSWYRLYDLLRDAIRREFGLLPPEQQQVTHLRAMDWWLENGDEPQAIQHAMDADDHERAAELLCTKWFEYMLSGLLQTLREWIDRFPTEAMLDYPPILVASAWIAAFSGEAVATHRFVAAARASSFDGPMPDGSTSYTSAIAILRAGHGHDGM